MATPNIFVSSTCYDLNEIRNNIRNFIKSFEYEPVMSEFGDIFYDYNLHVQDACLKEIENCQMFLLIIGNNYGSSYYKNKSTDKNPSSITLMEFKKALSVNIAKHIFVNKLVKYDYDNYRRFLKEKYYEHFNKNEVSENEIESVKSTIRAKFDLEYYFPHESYKHIFKFIDIINELNMNNAIFMFETTTDIQNSLKKQWAGFMYEGLAKQSGNKYNQKDINELVSKIDNIDKVIHNLIREGNESNKISIDINSIRKSINYSDLEQKQEIFDRSTYELLFNPNCIVDDKRRGYFTEQIDFDKTLNWLNSLEETLKKFIWSKTISFYNVFYLLSHIQFEDDEHIPYKVLVEINSLFQSTNDELKEAFVQSMTEKLKILEQNESEVAVALEDDDLPF